MQQRVEILHLIAHFHDHHCGEEYPTANFGHLLQNRSAIVKMHRSTFPVFASISWAWTALAIRQGNHIRSKKSIRRRQQDGDTRLECQLQYDKERTSAADRKLGINVLDAIEVAR
jgi:hypothetical protein